MTKPELLPEGPQPAGFASTKLTFADCRDVVDMAILKTEQTFVKAASLVSGLFGL